MKKIITTGFVIGLFTLLIGNVPVEAQTSSLALHEITIEVQPKIIALPGGAAGKNIAKVPIAAARVRNTELRDLNKLYNAVSIERIFEVVSSSSASIGEVAGNKLLKSKKIKKSKLEGKRILRKTNKGFFESDTEGGKITRGRSITLKEKKALKSKDELIADEQGISEEDILVIHDIFIIGFQDYKDADGSLVSINMGEAVAAYNALTVVVSAVKN